MQLAGDRTPLVILAYSGFDELNQPFFYKYLGITGNIQPMEIPTSEYNATAWSFVVYKEDFPRSHGPLLDSVTIPSSAFSGIATIHANFLTDYPAVNGVPYSDPSKGALQVFIQAKHIPVPIPPAASMLAASSKVWTNAEADAADGFFDIAITVHDVLPDLQIVGIQFVLEVGSGCDLTVLDVVEGDFIKQFGEVTLIWYWESPNVIVGELQLPPWPGESGWMTGSGTLATIKFATSYRAPPSCASELTLLNAFMVDANAERVDLLVLEHGYYEITP